MVNLKKPFMYARNRAAVLRAKERGQSVQLSKPVAVVAPVVVKAPPVPKLRKRK